jgi:exosortase
VGRERRAGHSFWLSTEGRLVSYYGRFMPSAETVEPSPAQKFQSEFRACWEQIPNKALFFSLLALWALLFHLFGNSTFGYTKTKSLFGWMYFVYNSSPDDGHCLLIPFVVLALFWWKRAELMAVPKQPWWPGVILVALGLALHLIGFMAQQGRISIVGLFTGIYGLMGLAWGFAFLRASFFPFFLFAFCIPLGTMADTLTFPLRMMVSWIAAGFSQLVLGIDVIRVGTQLFDARQTFQYDVAAACSGIRSLTVLVALTTIYGFITFRATWKRLLMIVIALPLAVVGNVIRITGVIITAEAFGEKAGMKFHDYAGFVTFALALICVMALGVWLREDSKLQRA